jgi:hypothetical protein
MSEIKEPEQILREVFDLLAQLEKVKVKAEWPIPVKKDRDGKLAKDYTLKDWHCKEQEEAAEALEVAVRICTLDEHPSELMSRSVTVGLWRKYLEEECDKIHTIFSKLHQFGYTEEEIAAGIHRSNEKAKERGLID